MIRLRHPLAFLLAGACLPPLAQAQSSPYYIGASQTFTRESNLLRLRDGEQAPAGFSKSDTISSTALIAGIDQPIGRQRLFGNAVLRSNRLSNNDLFNNQGYSLSGGLDFETINRISGSLTASANRNLARFNTEEIGLVTKKNLESTQQADAVIRIGVVTALTAEAAIGTRSVDYSAVEYLSREFRQNVASLGVRYRPRSSTMLGVALRESRGRYPKFRLLPDGSFESDRYTRRNLDLSASVAPSTISSFDGRLSLGKTEYDVSTQRDFSGVTGNFGWKWQPTGKLRFDTRVIREPGQDTYFLDNTLTDNTVEYSRVTTTLRVRTDYELSAKILLNATAGLSRRSLAATLPAVSGVPTDLTGSDRTATLSLGARWVPTRSVTIGCDASTDKRRGDAPLSSDLTNNSFGCFGQVTLQ